MVGVRIELKIGANAKVSVCSYVLGVGLCGGSWEGGGNPLSALQLGVCCEIIQNFFIFGLF